MNLRGFFEIPALIVMVVVGVAFALAMGVETAFFASTAKEAQRITPDTPGISEEEFIAYAGRMELKYGPEAVNALRLHISNETQGPTSRIEYPASIGLERQVTRGSFLTERFQRNLLCPRNTSQQSYRCGMIV